MQCTNYSAEPFKTIKTTYNEAAADYVATLIQHPNFSKWLGSEKLPAIKDLKITNANGEVWDIRNVLATWLKQEAIKEGFATIEGNPYTHPISEAGILTSLNDGLSFYNSVDNPFKGRIVRTMVEDQPHYKILVEFNKQYRKSTFVTAASGDKVVAEKKDTSNFFYMRGYAPERLSKGEKTISVRPDLYKEGVYNVGNEFFRVKLRNRNRVTIKEVGESSKSLRKKFIQDDAIEYRHIQQFFDGKSSMFVYDIEKIDITEEEGRALPDFVGAMGLKINRKAPGAKYITGYGDVDKYIETLLETKNELYRQRSAVRKDQFKTRQLDYRIETIDNQVESLKKDSELSNLMVVGNSILSQLQKELPDIKTFREIDTAMRLAKAWSELDQVINFLPDEDEDQEVKDALADAGKLRDLGQTLFTHLKKQYTEKLIQELDTTLPKVKGRKRSKEITDDLGNIQFVDVDKLGAWTIGKSFSANAMEQLLNEVITKADYEAEQESYNFEIRMSEATQKLLGKRADEVKAKDLDFLFSTDSMGNKVLVSKYDRNFYKQLYINRYLAFDKRKGKKPSLSDNYNAALALGASADDLKADMTFEDYYKWEKKYMEYSLTPAGKDAFEQFMKDVRESHITGHELDGTPIYDEKAIAAVEKDYDPQVFQDYIDGKVKRSNKGSRWFTKMATNAPVSKEFAKMDAKQREFYDYYIQEYLEGQQDLVIDHRFGDVEIDRQLLSFVIGLKADLGDRVKHLGKNLSSFVKGLVAVRYFDNPIVTNSRSVLTDLERKGPRFREVTDFIPDEYRNVDVNPLKVLTEFRKWGHLYKHKRDIEDKLNAIKDLSITAKNVELTNDGRPRNTVTGKLFTSNRTTNLADRIEYNVDVALTGQRQDPHLVNSGGQAGEWKASGTRVLDSINNYTRIKNMALSPMSGVGNFLMGSINNFLYASSGEFYNDKELAQAYWILKENFLKAISMGTAVTPTARKIAELMRRYSILGDVTEELFHENDLTRLFFVFQQNGEFMNQAATAIAQMLRQKVELADGSKKSLFDMWELDDKSNRVIFRSDKLKEEDPFKEEASIKRFIDKVKKVNMKVHGDYTNPMMAKKEVWGRMLFMFRTWLPMAVKERFGKEYTDDLLGKQKGRYRSAWSVFTNLRNKDNNARWQDLAVLIGKIAMPIIGRKLKFSKQLSDVDRNNLALFVREVHFILTISMAIAACKAQVEDEDDEETKSLLTWLYNQGERTQSELMFFFMPKDFMQITKDVLPMSQTLVEAFRVITRSMNYAMDPEDDIYERGVNEGKSKLGKSVHELIPVWRSIEKTQSAASQIFTDTRYQ